MSEKQPEKRIVVDVNKNGIRRETTYPKKLRKKSKGDKA